MGYSMMLKQVKGQVCGWEEESTDPGVESRQNLNSCFAHHPMVAVTVKALPSPGLLIHRDNSERIVYRSQVKTESRGIGAEEL